MDDSSANYKSSECSRGQSGGVRPAAWEGAFSACCRLETRILPQWATHVHRNGAPIRLQSGLTARDEVGLKCLQDRTYFVDTAQAGSSLPHSSETDVRR